MTDSTYQNTLFCFYTFIIFHLNSTTDLLNLSNIIPEYSFKHQIDASRGINVHGRHYSSDKNLDGEESTDDNKLYQPRQTRSGHSFSSIIEQSKPILKNKTESFSDMNAVPLAQARATRRGVCFFTCFSPLTFLS